MKEKNLALISTPYGVLASCVSVLLLLLALPGGGGFWPLLLVACVPFMVSIFRAGRRQAFFFAFFFGTVHFLVQLYWIVFVIGHYGGLPLCFAVPVLLLLCMFLAFYFVIFTLFSRFFVTHFSLFVCLWLIPCTWVAMDYLQSIVFSGFPWMDLGYGLAGVPLLMQSADLFGHYGLTFILVQVNTLFALCLLFGKQLQGRKQMAVTVCLVVISVLSYSTWRWQQLDKDLKQAKFLRIGIVQGNIDQGQKWDPARQGATVRGYLLQSRILMQLKDKPDLLLWPETALSFFPPGHPLTNPISRFLRDEQVMLLTGSPWFESVNTNIEDIQLFNSSLLFDTQGRIVNRTDKSHLVPFGEYVPLKRFLPFIAPLVEGVGNFIPGTIENPPACKNGRIGVLICFESVFPDISRKWVDAGANILVNITNDAWYGRSSAPHQTLAMTRLRAVETRRALVRSANTGFSAFIDPLGRVEEESPLFVSWESTRRAVIRNERTVFVRGGFAFAPGCLLVSFFAFVVCLRRKYRILECADDIIIDK